MNSRRKGGDGERELAAALLEELGVRMVRNLEQSRGGGHDLVLADDETGPLASRIASYAIEVKRAAKVSPALVRRWWGQCRAQAGACYKVPCLAYREDRQGWCFVVPLRELNRDMPAGEDLDWCAVLTLKGWSAMVRET